MGTGISQADRAGLDKAKIWRKKFPIQKHAWTLLYFVEIYYGWDSPDWMTYVRKRMFSFIFMRLPRVVMLYTILWLVESVYKPQLDELVLVEPVWQNRVYSVHTWKSNVPVWTSFPHATLFEEETIYPAKFRKNHHKYQPRHAIHAFLGYI